MVHLKNFWCTTVACFIAPAIAGIIVSIIRRVFKGADSKVNLSLLEVMLWGGVLLLAFEHLWHGELVPWPPFLTSMQNSVDRARAINEITTTGIAMAIAVTALWGGIAAAQSRLTKIRSIHSTAVDRQIMRTA